MPPRTHNQEARLPLGDGAAPGRVETRGGGVQRARWAEGTRTPTGCWWQVWIGDQPAPPFPPNTHTQERVCTPLPAGSGRARCSVLSARSALSITARPGRCQNVKRGETWEATRPFEATARAGEDKGHRAPQNQPKLEAHAPHHWCSAPLLWLEFYGNACPYSQSQEGTR